MILASRLAITRHESYNRFVFGRNRGQNKPTYDSHESRDVIKKLISQYESLINDYDLNPSFLESFKTRLDSAKYGGRNVDLFLEEELKEFRSIRQMVQERQRNLQQKAEAMRRNLAGETHADKILEEYKQRIEDYGKVDIHPNADPEVAKLYGAIAYFDSYYWDSLETYLRQAFPQPGQIDRMSIEHRFWRFVSSSEDKVPNALERYERVLGDVAASNNEKLKEAREAIKLLAFFLHELLSVCERAKEQLEPDAHIKNATEYVSKVIEDFRLKSLKRFK